MRCLVPLCLAALLLPATPRAQTASYRFFGRGCYLSNIPMAPPFTVVGTPKIGTTFRVQSGPSSRAGGTFPYSTTYVVLTGLSNSNYGIIKLPLQLPGFCGLLRTSVLHKEATSYITYDLGEVAFKIPNHPGLVGLHFYQQVACLHWTAQRGSWFYSLSRGGHGIIGT